MSVYFTLVQSRHLALSLLGGLLLVTAIAVGYWSFRLSLARRESRPGDLPNTEFPDGIQEGREAVPLLVLLLIAGLLIWGTAFIRVGLSEDRHPDYGTLPFVPAESPYSTGPESR
jgi:hypothetical protein